ncbi:MAG: type 11 methyltransferase [Gemmatimonadetes bacterium]|nr:type 11 methyltransferase [Gemmatimonadota bacterium]
MESTVLSPAAAAFDAIAERFDTRFGAWASVAAQRRAVRSLLLSAFPRGARVVEVGGGTGEDAGWLMRQGRSVLLTDASPSMVRIANDKLRAHGTPSAQIVAAEQIGSMARDEQFDGAFSNFAALNCVSDLDAVARGLAGIIRPGGKAMLVLFGVCAPGEWLVQLLRGDLRAATRRFSRGDVRARLGGREFSVRYHRTADIQRAMSPWFTLCARRGIGVCVPPSGAEPWISAHPRLLALLERLDLSLSRPLALLGDHVLFEFQRTNAG